MHRSLLKRYTALLTIICDNYHQSTFTILHIILKFVKYFSTNSVEIFPGKNSKIIPMILINRYYLSSFFLGKNGQVSVDRPQFYT